MVGRGGGGYPMSCMAAVVCGGGEGMKMEQGYEEELKEGAKYQVVEMGQGCGG